MNAKTFNPFNPFNLSNPSGKLTALGIFALVAIIWAGSGMAAQGDQDRVSTLSRQGGLQIREAADEVGLVLQGGITRGQTIRFDVFLFSAPCNAASRGASCPARRNSSSSGSLPMLPAPWCALPSTPPLASLGRRRLPGSGDCRYSAPTGSRESP